MNFTQMKFFFNSFGSETEIASLKLAQPYREFTKFSIIAILVVLVFIFE
jgi:hypothetical protein